MNYSTADGSLVPGWTEAEQAAWNLDDFDPDDEAKP